jgi:NAD(P)-dependent dehydrogenase (short-subunit alcohol dehydrogenase family)|tara:strand:+ start:196 stop:954 length:759 start_codon:yes stop_codon:yes gene_type:complete
MKNKTVLITGSSKRIGRSIALKLAEKGFNIAIHYNKSRKESDSLQKELETYKIKVKTFKLDLQKTNRIKPFFKSIVNYFGEINVLINNASTFEFDSIKSSTINSYDKHLDVNLKAPFFLSKYFVEAIGKKKGNIINILDQRVMNTTPYFTSYTISKSALLTLTRSLALSLAPKIRVNAIAPGPTLKSIRQTKGEFEKQILRTPLKKKVSLEEINNGILFLLKSETITGQTILLDSGQNMGWAHTKSIKFIDD